MANNSYWYEGMKTKVKCGAYARSTGQPLQSQSTGENLRCFCQKENTFRADLTLALTWFALDVSPKFDPEALANFRPKAYRVNTPLPVPAIKVKTDWTLPNGGRPLAAKRDPLSTAETCTALQVH